MWAGWQARFEDYSAPTPLPAKPHPLPEGIEGVKRMILIAEDPRHASLVALCGLMGLRVAEALTVKPSNFNTERMTLVIRGKGDKEREIPVSHQAWEILQGRVLRAFIAGDEPIVNMCDRTARSTITGLGVKAGICRRVSSHDLRATFGTEVYNNTKDLRLVQILLGHASSRQTEGYVGVSDSALRAGVEL